MFFYSLCALYIYIAFIKPQLGCTENWTNEKDTSHTAEMDHSSGGNIQRKLEITILQTRLTK